MIKISRIPLSLDSAVKSDPELDRVSASFGEEETKSKIQKSPWNSCNSQIGGKKAKNEWRRCLHRLSTRSFSAKISI